jgi:hypothetical protein
MAVTDLQPTKDRAYTRPEGYPAGGIRFDLIATALSAWVVIGVFVDVHAHNHGQVDNTFFTPWHALLYSGVLAVGAMLVFTQYRNVSRGYAWTRALPKGYLLSLVGVALFFAGGGFDFAWHSAFGFEANIEALLSPAHLLLATSALLFLTGPLRATWGRSQAAPGWAGLFAAITSMLMVISVLMLFTEFANAITSVDLYVERQFDNYTGNVATITGVLIPATLLMGGILMLLRRWNLPFGSMTFVIGINGILMFWLREGFIGEHWKILIGIVICGVIADLLLYWLRPSPERVGALRMFAFLVPFVYFLLFFVILLLTGRIWWSIHMWLGATFMAGITGLFLSYLVAPPAVPETEKR